MNAWTNMLATREDAASRLGVGLEVQQFYDPVVAQDSAAVEAAERAIPVLKPLAIHGPFGDLCPGSFDAMIRDATRHRFELGSALAGRIGAQHLIFHHGYVPGTSPHPNWIRRCSAFWRDFLAARSASVQFHVENMVEHGPELLRDVLLAIHQHNPEAIWTLEVPLNTIDRSMEWLQGVAQRT